MKHFRLVFVLSLVLVTLFCLSPFASAGVIKGGFAGISTYTGTTYGNCPHGNRAGAQYVNQLDSALSAYMPYYGLNNTYTTAFYQTNNGVTQASVIGATSSTFFAYAGHGYGAGSTTPNAMHVYKPSSGTHDHSNSSLNIETTEISFSHRYVTMYSCNWLANGGSTTKQNNIYATHNGTRLTMGFASTMYLDSREGWEYGYQMLVNAKSIKNAYIAAAQMYQPQRADGDSIARVVGYTTAASDKLTDMKSAAPSYSSSPTSFSVITTVTIPHNGIAI